MKVFIGYGFNERDRWVEQLVFPLAEAFGAETVTGHELQGDQITDAVRTRIRQCDKLLGFTTRRDELSNGKWSTHRWVTDELAHALALTISVVEIREAGVEDQGGIVGDRERILYDGATRDQCLVEIAKVLGRWRRETNVLRVQLLSAGNVKETIVPLYRKPGFRCIYRLLRNGDESPPTDA
jgi:hypothetical protein